MNPIRLFIASAIAFTSASFGAYADNADVIDIDLNKIEVDVTMNPDHYRQLLQRYENADATLSLEDMATVYYGSTFTYDYNPDTEYESIENAYEKGEYSTALAEIMRVLPADPLRLDLLVKGVICASKSADPEEVHLMGPLAQRYQLIVQTILASGKGHRVESPLYVISDRDITTLLNDILGVQQVMGRSMIGPLDAWKIRFPGSPREHILYFDNTRYHAVTGK